MENNDSYREYMLMGPHKLEYVRKSLLSGNHNTFDYLCETIFSGISTGTEIVVDFTTPDSVMKNLEFAIQNEIHDKRGHY